MNHPFFEARGLVKRFGRAVAVDDVSFHVNKGEVLTLLGPSGCGKTTTLRMIAGFELPDQGEVEIKRRIIVSAEKGIFTPPEKRNMGMVFQSYAIWPHMTVFENVAYPLKRRRIKKTLIRDRVREVLDLVGLGRLENRPAPLLSGGEQQRVALARALVYSPEILLLDEPLSNLDAKLREEMRMELKNLQSRLSITFIFVTHDQIEAMTLSDRLAVMHHGKIDQTGTPQEIYQRPRNRFVQEFIGRVVWFEGRVSDADSENLSLELHGEESTRILSTENKEGLKNGDDVIVAIRPEEIEVGRDSAAGESNQVPCSVEKRVFLGDRIECHLRYGEKRFALTAPLGTDLSNGQTIRLRFSPRSVHVWRQSEPS